MEEPIYRRRSDSVDTRTLEGDDGIKGLDVIIIALMVPTAIVVPGVITYLMWQPKQDNETPAQIEERTQNNRGLAKLDACKTAIEAGVVAAAIFAYRMFYQ